MHYVIPVVFCSAGAGTQESAHQHRHGSIQTPVTDDTKGMTNQSGNDYKLLADRRMSAGRFTGVSPTPGTGLISTIPAPAFCTLPAYRHHNTFHAAAPQFDGFREMPFADQRAKTFVSHTGKAGDVTHLDQGIVGTQQYAVVACCSQHGQNVLCEIYEVCANAGKDAEPSFQNGPADPGYQGLPAGNGLPDHTHHDYRGQNH